MEDTNGDLNSNPANSKTVARRVWRYFFLLGFSYGPMAYSMARRLFVDKLRLMTERDITDGIAVGEVMPGAALVDFVSYLGFLLRRVRGSFLAMLLFILPSFALMVLLSFLYLKFGELSLVRVVLRGLSAIMIALIIKVVIDIYRSGVKEPKFLSASAVALFLLVLDVNIVIILVVGVLGTIGYGMFSKQLIRKKGRRLLPTAGEVKDYVRVNIWILWSLSLLVIVNASIYFFAPPVAIMNGVLFKIGLLTFGNGYTMLPFIYKEVVLNFHWLTPKEFSDGIVLGQITPGPVVITATFIGYKVAGLFGAATATLSIFLPSTILVTLAAGSFVKYKDSKWAEFAMKGVLSSFIGLLILVVAQLARQNITDYKTALFALAAVVLFVYTEINPIILLAAGIVASLLFLR